jgi:serine/threonine-protein kinase
MPQPVADRNLLFGVLAMQMDFITREQLIAAMQAWVFDKTKPLGEILAAQKALADDNRQLLEALVQKHLAMHGNDAEKSLAAVSSVASVKKELAKIADADVQASLAHVAAAHGKEADPYATVAPAAATTYSGQRFRIVRPHARGGLGEVYVARDEELHREVALKEILERHADNAESRSRFMIEAEITGGLEHPGIVPVYGLGTYADGRPYYAMRFIRGDSLKDAIERFHKVEAGAMAAGPRAVELRALLGRFIDVCNAIAYAHMRGVLHRDLKPGNIMLGKYGETLVVDWGLAKPLGEEHQSTAPTEPGEGSLIPSSLGAASHTLAGSALGTPQYMSPEQAAGRLDQLGPASDVYSLGATLFCLLTGEPPIGDKDVGSVLQKVQRGDIPRPRSIKPDVPIPLEAICLKAMALKLENRYATPLALAKDVEQWLADEPVAAWPEPWTVKARRWIGRHRTLVTGVAAALAVALVSLSVVTVLLTAANERERLARAFAEEQKNEADKQKLIAQGNAERAEMNFQLARAAVDRYHTEVSESVLLHEPGMGPLRKKLLEAAREYYAKFVQERAVDPAVRGELGKATYRLAQITGDIDSPPKAIALHEQAVKVFATLPAAQISADTQADLADCWTQLARLFLRTDQAAKAEYACATALGHWQRLVDEHPEAKRYEAGLARAQFYLGNVYQQKRQLDEAIHNYQQAIAGRNALALAHPKVAEYQRDLATSHNNLALIYHFKGKAREAETEYRAALGIQQQLADDAPHISQYQNDLARTHANLGDLLGPARGEGEYQEVFKLRKQLAERHPSFIEYQSMLAESCLALARAHIAGKEFKKAEDDVQQALTIQRKLAAEHKDVPAQQDDLGRGLFALAEAYRAAGKTKEAAAAYQDAVQIQDKLVAVQPKVLHYQAALARSYQGLAFLYLSEKKTEPAAQAFRNAAKVWTKLVKEKAGELEYTRGLELTQAWLSKLEAK